MATIRKRDNRYQVQVRRKGFDPVVRSFHLLKDAQEWARLIETKADRHGLAPNRKVLGEITLGQLVERYHDSVAPYLKASANETITLNAFLRHSICRKTLAALTTSDFSIYRDERLREITPKSLQRTLARLNHMFRLANDEWEIPVPNPLSRLRLEVRDNKRQRRLTSTEFKALLEAPAQPEARWHPSHHAYAQLLLSISGTNARYGTTETPEKFWAEWREEAIPRAEIEKLVNIPLTPDQFRDLFAERPTHIRNHCEALWSKPVMVTDQDVAITGLLEPARFP